MSRFSALATLHRWLGKGDQRLALLLGRTPLGEVVLAAASPKWTAEVARNEILRRFRIPLLGVLQANVVDVEAAARAAASLIAESVKGWDDLDGVADFSRGLWALLADRDPSSIRYRYAVYFFLIQFIHEIRSPYPQVLEALFDDRKYCETLPLALGALSRKMYSIPDRTLRRRTAEYWSHESIDLCLGGSSKHCRPWPCLRKPT